MYQQLKESELDMVTSNKITRKINICEEEPIVLYLNGKKLVTFMCTPIEIKELAIGYLFSNRIINDYSELMTLAACEDMKEVYAITLEDVNWERLHTNTIIMSGCGSGKVISDGISHLQKINSSISIPIDDIRLYTKNVLSNAEIYKETGGMHCAAICDEMNILAMSEDVGRHNAVDKVIGKGVLLNTDFNKTLIITTGRISTDMVLKAVNISCPMIVSISIVTTMALRLAKELGVNIIGRALSSEPMYYY